MCKNEHPLYTCPQFKSSSHENKISIFKLHGHCLNCLRAGHFVKQCKSNSRCKKCQISHHTLLHIESKSDTSTHSSNTIDESVSSNAAAGPMSNSVLMTCCVLAYSPDGSKVKARALLDSASSASFASECLSQSLCLARSHRSARIYGIAGLSRSSSLNAVASFSISPTQNLTRKLHVTAIIVPKVTCDLSISPIYSDRDWRH